MNIAEIARLQRNRLGLTATAGPPLVPPTAWSRKQEPDEPTGLTVTNEGQVYGHAALWGTCHIGKVGQCVTPPRSRTRYRFFRTGLTDLQEGGTVPTGRITLGTGHAPLTASPTSAAEHYDDTGAVVADVVAHDGRHGIWIAGLSAPT